MLDVHHKARRWSPRGDEGSHGAQRRDPARLRPVGPRCKTGQVASPYGKPFRSVRGLAARGSRSPRPKRPCCASLVGQVIVPGRAGRPRRPPVPGRAMTPNWPRWRRMVHGPGGGTSRTGRPGGWPRLLPDGYRDDRGGGRGVPPVTPSPRRAQRQVPGPPRRCWTRWPESGGPHPSLIPGTRPLSWLKALNERPGLALGVRLGVDR